MTKSNNSLKVVGTYSKAARGSMANFIVKNKLESIDELKEFGNWDIISHLNLAIIN